MVVPRGEVLSDQVTNVTHGAPPSLVTRGGFTGLCPQLMCFLTSLAVARPFPHLSQSQLERSQDGASQTVVWLLQYMMTNNIGKEFYISSPSGSWSSSIKLVSHSPEGKTFLSPVSPSSLVVVQIYQLVNGCPEEPKSMWKSRQKSMWKSRQKSNGEYRMGAGRGGARWPRC